jgi:uncharacterized protein (TIGR03437 family)
MSSRDLLFLLFLWAPLHAQTLNMSHDLVTNGIASSNMIPDSPALDSRPLLEAAVAYASANAITTLTADPGAYYFLSYNNATAHALLNGAGNLTIDWQHSDLLFAFSNIAGIECLNCAGVTLQNFTLDYLQLPFTQVTVASVNAAAQTVSFNAIPGYQSPSDFNDNRAADGSDAIFMFIFRNGVPIQDVGRLAAQRPVNGNTIAIADVSDPWAAPARLAALQPGDTIVFTDRGGPPAINFVNGQSDAVRYASIYSSGQIGLYFGRTNGATADHVQVIPSPGTTRLISTNADGIHTSFALGANVFTNNIVRRTCDDALAISSPWLAMVSAVQSTGVTVARNLGSPFPPGTSVSFINPDTDAIAGTATIVAESPPYSQQNFSDGETVTLTLDQPVSGLAANFGMVVNDPAQRGSGSMIAYNTVQEGVFSRGVWLSGVQNVAVHDNYIQRTSSNGIFIQQLSGNNTDAGPATGITISNNLVDQAINYANVSHGVTFAAASIYAVSQNSSNAQVTTTPHSNITVSGNRVTNSARTAIRLENVNTGAIMANVVQGFGLASTVNAFSPPSCCETLAQYEADFQQAVLTPSSVSISASGNSIGDTSALLDTSSTANGYPRLAAGSLAAAYLVGGLNSPTLLASPPYPLTLGGVTVAVTDSGGVSRSAAVQAIAGNQVNYVVPDATAPGIATVTIGLPSGASASGSAQIDTIGPGLYTISGTGQGLAAAGAALYEADGGIQVESVFQCTGDSCTAAPLSLGNPGDQLALFLYGTGLRNNSGLQNSFATIGGVQATVLYVGAQPQYPGLDQVNLIVPPSLAGAGQVSIVLTVDGQTANVVTVSIQ